MNALKIAFANLVLLLIGTSAGAEGLVWDSTDKKIILDGMTNRTQLTFWVTNKSEKEITIFSAETSCECTVVDSSTKFPWQIAPSEGGPMHVNVNTRGIYGLMEKSILLKTSQGIQTLGFHLQIPLTPAPYNRSVREQDVEAARADRQSVFQGHCAACHSLPTRQLTGAALFEKACGICHLSEHRAEFVPDIAALKRPTNEDYWKEIITHGKSRSVMPAFADSEGGILDKNQIQSLVEFLLKNYPSKSSIASGGPQTSAAKSE
jgi:mono/diheme cytochrome c family protein